MPAQVGYRINHPLNKEEVWRIKDYVTGPLCDLYGATTGIHYGGAPDEYVIERVNELPLLPRIDKMLEINVGSDCTLINCYFARSSWATKFKKKLEKLTNDIADIVNADWRIVDIERVLAEAE